ncbi:MAG: type I glyceraldehyde-3-phosphate dehydrogenase [Candidatus Moranbacteria bacterium RIFOXYB1_FULL_44_23]|nr:MAG: type I glyceraldehyde-3-phosphate dehydrogenase [Candidatus Moranbacteria bacterium RIFOXYC1_FULL_44_8]OGI39071.1 MAG: type I glyceraldehyde-3-phosphate dehydrogenase [Candidatus Moranbacteria bacterium RIFOXYB1_FULL_44_23]OGI42404.1 MAG: type I glyceraldehyde-3-phosphate dehydrogenase [Candidatus Moranbacteria bacterium RIFOXYD1_FULL_44_9]HBB36644.1 type I glyceraldehyde-3-phosphate dehydrogenase [Candidatus Moranbacteria bacterium]HBU25421.1 type I glyceraldehyde-3-phosphate dehydroge
MMIRIAINGFGRIGRPTLKIALEKENIEVAAINDLADDKTLAHLLKYDSSYGTYGKSVETGNGEIIVGGKKIRSLTEPDPTKLPWKDFGVDIVLECSGAFTKKEDAEKHIGAGAAKVILSAPPSGDGVPVYLLGINENEYNPAENVISNGSCTTNCLAPMIKVLDEKFGVEKGFMTTVHSYTNDQRILDLPHKDLRRARGAAQNIIPTSTGAAKTVGKAMKSLEGRLNGISMRVPTPVVSATDFVCVLKREASAEEINEAYRRASAGELKNILEVSEGELVSMDFKGNPASAIVDLPLTMANGNLVKIVGWYDNEWAYANRLVEMAEHISQHK